MSVGIAQSSATLHSANKTTGDEARGERPCGQATDQVQDESSSLKLIKAIHAARYPRHVYAGNPYPLWCGDKY